MVLILIFLLPLAKQDPSVISPKTLFVHSIFYLIPTVLFLFQQRKNLLQNPTSRQFLLGLFGTVFALFLHRWISVANHLPIKAIISTDFCILGVGCINMLPRIQTGITLAIFCAAIAIMSHIYPQLIWFGTLSFAIVAPMMMLIDWWREKNHGENM